MYNYHIFISAVDVLNNERFQQRNDRNLRPDKENELYFSIIKLARAGEILTLKFGISEQDYFYIKNIISFRPFENTAVGPYHYYFSGTYRKNHPTIGMADVSVRVEQNKVSKQHFFPVSNAFVANLLWFGQLNERTRFEKLIVQSDNLPPWKHI